MTSRELVRPRVLATGTASIATVTTTNVDFGTPDDVKVAVGANFQPGDRLVAVITASTSGTTDTTTFSVQDAPDNAGSIGTPATAVTTGALTGGTGNQYAVVGIQLQAGRPWIRVRATRASGTTDTHVIRVVLLAIPHGF
ncbi:hypothetical protein Cme02nite_69360 [Catellatospora methionotrophica]|uniref:Uncharacterized protein n=1 Tax=Catellatospora methionotrophica TaxID=121620 RepID=A0A8J3PJB8_9ACTN|nr:hypothetical protein [Catellatospora methionotrophica]GIG18604.1 hypothetical protein Cme02nite_69360 [Catellatospora methionotrophica]